MRNFAENMTLQWREKETSRRIAFMCAEKDGKMCVVPVRASPKPVHHQPLLAYGSTASCSAKLTIATAINTERKAATHGG